MLLEISEETKKRILPNDLSFAFFGMIPDEAQQYNVSSCSPLVVRETKITC